MWDRDSSLISNTLFIPRCLYHVEIIPTCNLTMKQHINPTTYNYICEEISAIV